MKPGLMAMMSKPRLSRHNEWGKDHPSWRKLEWVDPTWRWCGLLWLAWCNPLWIHSTWSDSKQGVLRSSSEAFEGSCMPEEASVVDEPELGVAPRQCAIFWRKMKRPFYSSHPTLQIWLQQTFFCFPSWSLPWKDAVSTHLTRSRKIQRRSCSPFWKKRSKFGRNVGSSVLLVKEPTLKATNLNKLYLSA